MNFSKYKQLVCGLAAVGLLLVGLVLLLNGDPLLVRAAAGDLFATPTGNGTACTQAIPCSLQTSLANATGGNTIYVATGTYTGSGAEVVAITESIALYGGWDGSPTGNIITDPDVYPTTLDGENARRVMYISGYIAPTVEGFIVTGGNTTGIGGGPGGSDAGGGINIENASPILANNIITNNIASTGTNFAYGGGIYLTSNSSSAVISGTLFAHNRANAVHSGEGGGLAVWNGNSVTLSNNDFINNTAGIAPNSAGGGVFLYNTPALVSENLFRSNKATPAGEAFGGGFYTQFGAINFRGNTIINNAAEYGAITFQSNTNVTVTNNIIVQNPAGGVFFRGSASYPLTGILAHNTIAQNGKEGVYAGWYGSGYSTLTLTNNIIVDHTRGIYAYPNPNPNIVNATHTLFYGNNNDTGGSTITSMNEITGNDPRFLDSAVGNYHLRPESPAIDSGAPVPWLTVDIDGDTRPLPTGGDYDIGADEAHWRPVYLPVVLNRSG